MLGKRKNEYILGTDSAELQRLGLQHQVWASEAHRGWELAGFTAGHSILDLGCGPGFCTKELAYVVGHSGKVLGIDKAENYIHFLQETAHLHGLPIEAIQADFNNMTIPANSLDGMYCRWALAWIPNPKEILQKILSALKPGGKMVIHEYFDWSVHQTQPSKPALNKALASSLRSFKEQPGDIDIGRELPAMLSDMGMLIKTRTMSKLATPQDLTWHWPKSFYEVYFPKLVAMGYLTDLEASQALSDFEKIEKAPGAHLLCPSLIEVIAEKV